jgi:hypothetical protein
MEPLIRTTRFYIAGDCKFHIHYSETLESQNVFLHFVASEIPFGGAGLDMDFRLKRR